MVGPKDVRRRVDSAVGQAVVAVGMGLLALWPGAGSQRLVFGILFVLGVLNLLLMGLGPWLVRRAEARGRLRGRHSRT
ncbi:hypothetical protein [Kitasatospora sp. NPDC090308]|uniref:hypothetical protein n=1 Tax=Kitasatospora sp. NPDC090308 TaxID=3364082 RepID=UPI0037F739F7